MVAFAPGDISIGAELGYYEIMTKLVAHEQWVYAPDDLGNIMRVSGETWASNGEHYACHDDPTQLSDYAPHDIVWLPDNSGLAVLIARLDNTLILRKYDFDRNILAEYTGLATDPDWNHFKYCKIDAFCDGHTILYTDRGRTIFQYDMTGSGTQLANYSQLLVGSPYIYGAFKILGPTGQVVVALTNSGNGPSYALCLDSDHMAMWTDKTNDIPSRIYKRLILDGNDTGDTYVVRGRPIDFPGVHPDSLACWTHWCSVARITPYVTLIGAT